MAMNFAQSLKQPPKRWSRSGSVVSELIVLVLIVVAIVGAAAGKFLIAVICGLVLALTIIARLWTRLALVGVDYACIPSQNRLMLGDGFDLVLTIENAKPLPLPWLSVSQAVPAGLELEDGGGAGGYFEDISIQDTASLGPYERVRFRHRLRAVRRGFYALGPTQIVSGDIFGFYTARLDLPKGAKSLVVYPRTVALPDFKLPPHQPFGDRTSPAHLIDDLTRPSGLREYRAGDGARRIDWKATARRREVFVRTYDSSQAHRVVILLECATCRNSWRFVSAVQEEAVSAAASVALRSLELGYAVGLVCNGQAPGGSALVPPGAGPDQPSALLTALAGVQALTTGRLENLLGCYGPQALPPGATVVYIAAYFRPTTVGHIIALRHRGHRIVSLCVGPQAPPEIPGLSITDYRNVFTLMSDDTMPGSEQNGE